MTDTDLTPQRATTQDAPPQHVTRLSFVPIGEIVVPDWLLRGQDDVDTSDLEGSMLEDGVLQPILLRPVQTPGGGEVLELVAGFRRLRTAGKVGFTELPAMIRPMTDDEALNAEIAENAARRAMPPHLEGRGMLRVIQRRFSEAGMELEEDDVKSWVYRLNNENKPGLLKGEATVKGTLFEEIIVQALGRIGKTVASFCADVLPALGWQPDILAAMERGQLTSREARALNGIKREDLRAEAVTRVAKGEKAQEVKAELLTGAARDGTVIRSEEDGQNIELYPVADGFMVGDRVWQKPEPSFARVFPAEDLLKAILAREEMPSRVVMIGAPTEQVLQALHLGVNVWSTYPSPRFKAEHRWARLPDEADLILLYANPERAVSLIMNDPNPEDFTSLEIMQVAQQVSEHFGGTRMYVVLPPRTDHAVVVGGDVTLIGVSSEFDATIAQRFTKL